MLDSVFHENIPRFRLGGKCQSFLKDVAKQTVPWGSAAQKGSFKLFHHRIFAKNHICRALSE